MQAPSGFIVRQESMNSWRPRRVNRGSRSTRRTASTARPATSRTRPRTSTGSLRKAGEVPITRTCKWLGGVAIAAVALTGGPAGGAISADPARAYVQARAAALSGDHARSAALLAALAEARPDQAELGRKAFTEALGAGQMGLALSVAARIPPAKLSTEARLLLVADQVRRKRIDQAMGWLRGTGDGPDLTFLSPLLIAWDASQRGDADRALASIDQVPGNSLLSPLKYEERALILLKFRRTAEAEPYARRAIGSAGARENRLRLALADGFLEAGDRDRALMMIDGMGSDAAAARQRVLTGKVSGQAIDTAPEA